MPRQVQNIARVTGVPALRNSVQVVVVMIDKRADGAISVGTVEDHRYGVQGRAGCKPA